MILGACNRPIRQKKRASCPTMFSPQPLTFPLLPFCRCRVAFIFLAAFPAQLALADVSSPPLHAVRSVTGHNYLAVNDPECSPFPRHCLSGKTWRVPQAAWSRGRQPPGFQGGVQTSREHCTPRACAETSETEGITDELGTPLVTQHHLSNLPASARSLLHTQ